jgi:hypothetical protein
MPDGQSIIRLSFTINMDGAVSRNNTLDERKEVVAVVGVTAGRRFLMARPPVLTGQNGEVLKIFEAISIRFRAGGYQKIKEKNKVYSDAPGWPSRRSANHSPLAKKKSEVYTPTSVLPRDTNQRRLVT